MKKEDLKIVFMGTPEFAVETLKALILGGYNVVAVVTQPDKFQGRHQTIPQASKVKQYALSQGLPILQPLKLKDEEFLSQLRAYNADLQVVVAFRLLPEVVWAMPHFGTFNVHAALLPQYRGAAPINWAVINGEKKTGVTTFFIDKDVDTGKIILQKTLEIKDTDNVGIVHDNLMHLGALAAIETVDKIILGDGYVDSIAQEDIIVKNSELFLAPKIYNETCQIFWQQEDKKIYDFIRGLSPYPGAWTYLTSYKKEKKVLKIFKSTLTTISSSNYKAGSITIDKGEILVATNTFFLKLDEVQLSGKRRMIAKEFINGFRDIESHLLE